jgi:hypothetical protein
MAADWFYTKDGTRFGPIDAAKLKQLADSGVIRPDDLVWKQGVKQWAKAAAVKGLFDAQAVAAGVGVFHQTEPLEEATDIDTVAGSGTDSGDPIVVQARKRTFRKRKTFPALGFVAGIFTLIAVLITTGGVIACIGVLAKAFGASQEVGGQPPAFAFLIAIGILILAAAFAVIYLASAEVIRLALYAVTLLEDIRDEA